MDRIVVGTTGTLSVTFDVDGTATDATGTVTVAGVGLDGTTLFSGNASAGTANDGIYTYTVGVAYTTQPDIVTVTWSGTWSGAAESVRRVLHIVGDHYFTIAELRAWETAVASTSSYSLAALERARAWAETRAEEIMGRSFVRSVDKVTRTCCGEDELPLRRRDARSVRYVSLDGTSQTVANYTLRHKAVAPSLYGTWPEDMEAVVIYEHGATYVPEDVARAVATLAREYAVRANSAIPNRAERWQPDGSGGLYQLASPGRDRTGHPEVDSVLHSYRTPGIG